MTSPGYWALVYSNYPPMNSNPYSFSRSENLVWNTSAKEALSWIVQITGNNGIEVLRYSVNKFGERILN